MFYCSNKSADSSDKSQVNATERKQRNCYHLLTHYKLKMIIFLKNRDKIKLKHNPVNE